MMKIALIIFRVLLGVLLFAAGSAKLAGVPMMVQEFDIVGLGQWFRYFTGGCEVIGALLLIRPKTVTLGAMLIACVCAGALYAQLFILHGDPIHTIVLGAIAGWLAWSYRDALKVAA